MPISNYKEKTMATPMNLHQMLDHLRKRLGKLMSEYLPETEPLNQAALEAEIRRVMEKIDMIERLMRG
jgi:hypothetical protein